MSGGLDRVSRMKAIAAALLRFCTSTLVPGCFFSNALANGTVRSLENDVTMTSLSPMPCAEAAVAISAKAAASVRRRVIGVMAGPPGGVSTDCYR